MILWKTSDSNGMSNEEREIIFRSYDYDYKKEIYTLKDSEVMFLSFDVIKKLQ